MTYQELRTLLFHPLAQNERGMAMVTVILVLLILSILGIASITITGLENRMAGFAKSGELAATAAESCLGVGANIIKQTWAPQNAQHGAVAPVFLSNAVPQGPVPLSNATFLHNEIFGKDAAGNDMTNNGDSEMTSPNLVINTGGYTVSGDIDRLYVQNTYGTGTNASTGGQQSFMIVYRISCVARNVAIGTASPATAVYGCVKHGGATDCAIKIL